MKINWRGFLVVGLVLVVLGAIGAWLIIQREDPSSSQFLTRGSAAQPEMVGNPEEIVFTPSLVGDTTAYLVVAASGASPEIQAAADYVATGNSDQDVIMEAVAALPPTGGIVHLSEGVFWIDNNLELRDVEGVTLRGSGWNTILRMEPEASFSNAGLLRVIEAQQITLEDMQLDGNKEAQTVPDNKYGFFSDTVEYIVVRNLHVHSFSRYGIDPHERTQHITIQNNLSENNGTDTELFDGITLDTVTHALIINNISRNNARHGINITTDSEFITIVNNYAFQNGSSGIIVQNRSHDVTITANTVEGNNDNGVFLVASDNNLVSRNYITESSRDGLELSGNYNIVEGNYFTNNGQGELIGEQDPETYSDIKLKENEQVNAQYNVILSNVIELNAEQRTRHGIEEVTEEDTYNYIMGNIIQGHTSIAIRTEGKESILLNNHFDWPFFLLTTKPE